MKKEEKIRMLLHPERYTDEQIEKMLNETPVAEPDVDEAWKHFKKVREEKQVTGVMPQQKPLAREVVWKKESKSVTSTLEEPDSTRHDQHFNNVPLQQIMQQISKDYGVDVVFNNDAARTIRFYISWDAEETLSNIVNRLNHFEKVHLTLSDETITIN